MSETLTWFGGYVGVRWNADTFLHLVDDDGLTFCKIRDGLRPVTRREAGSASAQFCESCLTRAQAARRDGPSPETSKSAA